MPYRLLAKNPLDLPNLLLNFSGNFFAGTSSFQFRIVTQLPGNLLELTLDFLKLYFMSWI